ncbi:hypothetical protein [Natrinema salinisoli]|uniref:hypothetical protein n=1 Tax=Natrinema salinisoli TaxID=2878535 RepID=UPI001CF01A4F|nr:hypothetical protein [Natrinema salinisoli]
MLLVALFAWPMVVSAHGAAGDAGAHGLTVPFVVVVGFSALVSAAIGLHTVARWQPNRTVERGRDLLTPIVVIAVGLVTFASSVTQLWALSVVGGMVGGTIAWNSRARGISPHDGCADVAFGAILVHRATEGAIIASVYAASAALGLIGLTILTGHAIAETVAVGGLYAPVSRGWGTASVIATQLSFIAGALFGNFLVTGLSTAMVAILLASVGGVLFVTGVTELLGHRETRSGRQLVPLPEH